MATFIGICATIIVGVQIVNHLEIRNVQKSVKAIESERNRMDYEQKAFSVEMYNTRLSVGNALALMAFTAQKNKDVVTEFNSWLHSIIIDDWSSMKGSALLYRYQRLSDISDTVIQAGDSVFLENTYKTLSVLDVPKDIEHFDKIMSLHYCLLSKIQKQLNDQSSQTENP